MTPSAELLRRIALVIGSDHVSPWSSQGFVASRVSS